MTISPDDIRSIGLSVYVPPGATPDEREAHEADAAMAIYRQLRHLRLVRFSEVAAPASLGTILTAELAVYDPKPE